MDLMLLNNVKLSQVQTFTLRDKILITSVISELNICHRFLTASTFVFSFNVFINKSYSFVLHVKEYIFGYVNNFYLLFRT